VDRILVTPRSLTAEPPPELGLLEEQGFELVFTRPGQQPSEAELIELVPGCVGWLAGVEPVSDDVVRAADRLRAISRNGVGVDNLPLDELKRRGIRVLRAEGANSVGVAELAIGLILSTSGSRPADGRACAAWRFPDGRWACSAAARSAGMSRR
jgi:D-3-phosphoglycerate dehydrogenase